jgi:hypothetical protein
MHRLMPSPFHRSVYMYSMASGTFNMDARDSRYRSLLVWGERGAGLGACLLELKLGERGRRHRQRADARVRIFQRRVVTFNRLLQAGQPLSASERGSVRGSGENR